MKTVLYHIAFIFTGTQGDTIGTSNLKVDQTINTIEDIAKIEESIKWHLEHDEHEQQVRNVRLLSWNEIPLEADGQA